MEDRFWEGPGAAKEPQATLSPPVRGPRGGVRGGEKTLPRGLRAEGIEGFRTDGQRVLLNHLAPRGLVGF